MESPSTPTVWCSRKTLIQVVFVCLYDEHTANSLFGGIPECLANSNFKGIGHCDGAGVNSLIN